MAAGPARAAGSSPTTGAATASRARPSRTCARPSTSTPRTSSCVVRGARRRARRRSSAPTSARWPCSTCCSAIRRVARAAVLVDPPAYMFVPEATEALSEQRAALEDELRAGGPELDRALARADRRLRRDRVAAARPRRCSRRSACRSRSSPRRGRSRTTSPPPRRCSTPCSQLGRRGRRARRAQPGRSAEPWRSPDAPSWSPGRPVASGITSSTCSPAAARSVVASDIDEAKLAAAPLPDGVRREAADLRSLDGDRRSRARGPGPSTCSSTTRAWSTPARTTTRAPRSSRSISARQPPRADGAHPRSSCRGCSSAGRATSSTSRRSPARARRRSSRLRERRRPASSS